MRKTRKPGINILIIVPEYPPYHIGGGGEVFKNLAGQFKKAEAAVTVVYGFYLNRSFTSGIKVYKQKGITFIKVPLLPYPPPLPWLKIRMPATPAALSQLRSYLSENNFDAVFVHGYGFPFIDQAAAVLKSLNKRYLLTVHGWPQKHQHSNFFIKSLTNLYLQKFSFNTLDKAEKITTVSNFLKHQLPKPLQKKSLVIPNGLDYTQFKENLNTKPLFKGKTIILSLGRLSYLKGFQEVIKLLPNLAEKFDVLYVLAGEDEGYKTQLITLAKKLKVLDRIMFINQLKEAEKTAYLKRADILAIPSFIEGFSLVTLEGMYFDKLILYNSSKAVAELLINYPKKAFIKDPSLIKKIPSLLKIKAKFDQKSWAWDKIAQKYLKAAGI